MASYCTSAKLTANLPGDLPTSMNATYLTTQITDASAECDELVGSRYARVYESNVQKFPNVSSTPATPKTIEQCALWLALSRCYETLDVSNFGAEDESTPRAIYFRNKAETKLARVASGEIDLSVEFGAQVTTIDRYFESDVETEKDWLSKRNEMDALWP